MNCSFHCVRVRLHVYQLPEVTIQVFETMAVHEAMLLLGIGCGSVGSDCLGNKVIDVRTALS